VSALRGRRAAYRRRQGEPHKGGKGARPVTILIAETAETESCYMRIVAREGSRSPARGPCRLLAEKAHCRDENTHENKEERGEHHTVANHGPAAAAFRSMLRRASPRAAASSRCMATAAPSAPKCHSSSCATSNSGHPARHGESKVEHAPDEP